VGAARGRGGSEPIRLSDARAPGNSMREHSRRLSKEVGSAKSPASLPIFSRLPSSALLRRGLRIRNCFRQTGPQRKGKRMFAEPTFIVSLSGLCGFILVVEDGEEAGKFPRIQSSSHGLHYGQDWLCRYFSNDFNLTSRTTAPCCIVM
jgi:hypothetical protein